jgi:hypothetical protein
VRTPALSALLFLCAALCAAAPTPDTAKPQTGESAPASAPARRNDAAEKRALAELRARMARTQERLVAGSAALGCAAMETEALPATPAAASAATDGASPRPDAAPRATDGQDPRGAKAPQAPSRDG